MLGPPEAQAEPLAQDCQELAVVDGEGESVAVVAHPASPMLSTHFLRELMEVRELVVLHAFHQQVAHPLGRKRGSPAMRRHPVPQSCFANPNRASHPDDHAANLVRIRRAAARAFFATRRELPWAMPALVRSGRCCEVPSLDGRGEFRAPAESPRLGDR